MSALLLSGRHYLLISFLWGMLAAFAAYGYEVGYSRGLIRGAAQHDPAFDGQSEIQKIRESSYPGFTVHVDLTNDLKPKQFSRMDIKSTKTGVAVQLKIHPDAIAHRWVMQEIVAELEGLTQPHGQAGLMMYQEFLSNALLGDPMAQASLIAYEESAVYRAHGFHQKWEEVFRLFDRPPPYDEKTAYLRERITDLQRRRNQLVSRQKTHPHLIRTLDLSMLTALASRNDRQGVAALLESSMPWGEMIPSEEIAYRQLISSIREPSKKKILLFRGLGANQMPTGAVGSEALFSEGVKNELYPAFQEFRKSARASDFYLPDFSKKQWSWVHFNSVISELRLHGHYSLHTPFISTSASLQQAISFSATGGSRRQLNVLMLELDERRVIANAASQFAEFEYLVPFLIFPDEIRATASGTYAQVYGALNRHLEEEGARHLAQGADGFFRRFEEFTHWFLDPCPHLLRK